jgi:hypothetical protein
MQDISNGAPVRRGAARLRQLLPEGRALDHLVWRHRHRVIVVLLWLHVLGVGIFGLARGYRPVHVLLEASVVAALAVMAGWGGGYPRMQTVAATLGLLTSSAVLVHLSGGSTEMHFHFFVMIGVITVYQDWLPFLLGIGFVALHHGVMGTIDPHSVFNHQAAWNSPWKWAGIHAIFILAASAAYLVGWRLSETDRAVAEEYALRLSEGQLRQRQALEINDSIVQGLVVAETAMAYDEPQLVREALAATLQSARQIVSNLLGEAESESRLGPGDLRRSTAAVLQRSDT